MHIAVLSNSQKEFMHKAENKDVSFLHRDVNSFFSSARAAISPAVRHRRYPLFSSRDLESVQSPTFEVSGDFCP